MHVGDPSIKMARIAPQKLNSVHIATYKLTSPQLKMDMAKAVSAKVSIALPIADVLKLINREGMYKS